jgi:hypothetical protein
MTAARLLRLDDRRERRRLVLLTLSLCLCLFILLMTVRSLVDDRRFVRSAFGVQLSLVAAGTAAADRFATAAVTRSSSAAMACRNAR